MDLIAAAVAKLTALSLPAKATGLGIAVALGATGGVAAYAADAPETEPDVVDVTEAEPPAADPVDDADDADDTGDVDDVDGDEDGTDDGDAPERDLPDAAQFGQSVAADARDGGVDGQEISERAHDRNEARRAADDPEPVVDEPAPVDPATTDAPPASAPADAHAVGTGRVGGAPGQDRRP